MSSLWFFSFAEMFSRERYYKAQLPAKKIIFDATALKHKYRITDEILLARVGVLLSFVLLGFFTEYLFPSI